MTENLIVNIVLTLTIIISIADGTDAMIESSGCSKIISKTTTTAMRNSPTDALSASLIRLVDNVNIGRILKSPKEAVRKLIVGTNLGLTRQTVTDDDKITASYDAN